jgi:hypothetical protein
LTNWYHEEYTIVNKNILKYKKYSQPLCGRRQQAVEAKLKCPSRIKGNHQKRGCQHERRDIADDEKGMSKNGDTLPREGQAPDCTQSLGAIGIE